MVIYVFALRKLFSAFHTEEIRKIQLVDFGRKNALCSVHGVHWTEYKWCDNTECKHHVIQ